MKPMPTVESMWHIFDWRGFVENQLLPLHYHTRYNSFKLTKENNEVKLRCKRLPQSPRYGPPTGLMLVKEDLNLQANIGSADFRIDQLNLDHLMQFITKRYESFPLFERIDIISNWESVCKKLRDLPKKKETLVKMSLIELPVQDESQNLRPLPDMEDQNIDREITGIEFKERIAEGDVEEVLPGMDVAVYTENKRGRPWVGKVLSINKDQNEFEIHWFEK